MILHEPKNSQFNDQLQIAVQAVRLYAETHPRPIHVTQRQASEMLGVSPSTTNKLVKSGVLKLNKIGLIPIRLIDEVLDARSA